MPSSSFDIKHLRRRCSVAIALALLVAAYTYGADGVLTGWSDPRRGGRAIAY
ncbi:MAG: hypothetical protein IIB36_03080 [Gemmatimonadetes bacterium]|nr:hypothetical protein [Gemmatimonadota bacterium]